MPKKTGYNFQFDDIIHDTLQNIFILAFESYDDIRNHPNILGWLVLTCNHRLIPYVEQQRRRQKCYAFSFDDPNAPLLVNQQDEIQQFYEKTAVNHRIFTLSQSLSKQEGKVFIDYFLHHHPYLTYHQSKIIL